MSKPALVLIAVFFAVGRQERISTFKNCDIIQETRDGAYSVFAKNKSGQPGSLIYTVSSPVKAGSMDARDLAAFELAVLQLIQTSKACE